MRVASCVALLLVSLLAASGCKDATAPTTANKIKPVQPSPPPSTVKTPAPKTPNPGAIRWHKDDLFAALADAGARDVPLVIDFWAPWCHTCLSMKHFVLDKPAIRALSARFSWLAIDTDKAVNAAAMGRFTISAWPTFLVLSPDGETLLGRLVGSADVDAFVAFLKRAESNRHAAKAETAGPLVLAGDRAAADGAWPDAIASYRLALDHKALGDQRPDVLVALIGALYKAQDWDACVARASKDMTAAAAANNAKALDFVAYGHYCAKNVSDASARALRTRIVAVDSRARAIALDPTSKLTPDDRSDGLKILRDVHDALDEKAAGTELAEAQRTLLEKAIRAAKSPQEAMTYNWPWVEVHHRLGRHKDAYPLLQQSVDALPNAYDPPYRMAWLLHKAGKPDEALKHARQALKHVYGPRKARVLGLVADINKATGDVAAERETRQALVTHLKALPRGQNNPKALAAAVEALGEMPPATK